MASKRPALIAFLALGLCGCPSPLPDAARFSSDAALAGDANVPVIPDVPATSDVPVSADAPASADVPVSVDVPVSADAPADTPQSDDVAAASDGDAGSQDADAADAGCAANGCGPAAPCQILTCQPGGACASSTAKDGTPCGTGQSCQAGACKSAPLEAVRVVAGGHTTCMGLSDGTVACWGDGGSGQLGDGQSGPGHASTTPVVVVGVVGATDVACSHARCCAVIGGDPAAGGGTVKCWGDNAFGGSNPGSAAPELATATTVQGVSGATAVAVGGGHTCALVAGGKVQCWGDGKLGQLGHGKAEVPGGAVQAALGSEKAVQIRAGPDHTCVRTLQGGVWCWGSNDTGQLGSGQGGTGASSTTPVAVPAPGLTQPTDLAAGQGHGCAIQKVGPVTCWGKNDSGQVGSGTFGPPLGPQSTGLLGGLQLAAGGGHTCAVGSSTGVWCWGANAAGQLAATGSPYPYMSKTPKQVVNFQSVAEVAAGTQHTCVRRTNGTVWCWGDNSLGQLGPQGGKSSVVPVQAF